MSDDIAIVRPPSAHISDSALLQAAYGHMSRTPSDRGSISPSDTHSTQPAANIPDSHTSDISSSVLSVIEYFSPSNLRRVAAHQFGTWVAELDIEAAQPHRRRLPSMPSMPSLSPWARRIVESTGFKVTVVTTIVSGIVALLITGVELQHRGHH